MRFYLDEDQSDLVADIAHRQFGLDVTSAHRVGTKGTLDSARVDRALTRQDRPLPVCYAEDRFGRR